MELFFDTLLSVLCNVVHSFFLLPARAGILVTGSWGTRIDFLTDELGAQTPYQPGGGADDALSRIVYYGPMQSFVSSLVTKAAGALTAFFMALFPSPSAPAPAAPVAFAPATATQAVLAETPAPKPQAAAETEKKPVEDEKPAEPIAPLPKEPEEKKEVKREPAKTAAPKAETPAVVAAPSTLASAAATSSAGFQPYPPGVSDKKVKDALVNIICASYKKGLPSMSGSGVVIDPRGVVLTNAHVGQYFLLEDLMASKALKCYIRSGNPAKTLYAAEPLYISREWIESNPEQITGTKSKGTGENDFAFLRISETADGSSPSQTFPHLPLSDGELRENDLVVAAGYPAEFIPSADIRTSLYALSAPSAVDHVYTFGKTSIDLVSMPGSVVAQRGSSGGALVADDGSLAGIIVTASNKFYNDQRRLYAITIPHIERSLKRQTREDIEDLLSGNISKKAVRFRLDDSPALSAVLLRSIERSATP